MTQSLPIEDEQNQGVAAPSAAALAGDAPSQQAVSALRAPAANAVEIMTELGALWMDYVCQDHHKDRDCHFSIDQSFSYGDPPVWTAAHFGYVDDGFGHACAAGSKERQFSSYDAALDFMIGETLAMFRRHVRSLKPETVEALKRLSAQFTAISSARGGQ